MFYTQPIAIEARECSAWLPMGQADQYSIQYIYFNAVIQNNNTIAYIYVKIKTSNLVWGMIRYTVLQKNKQVVKEFGSDGLET